MIDIPLTISSAVLEKLTNKHQVTEEEIKECFVNRDYTREFLLDTREEHKTNPPTVWFVAKTNKGRLLKVVWMYSTNNNVIIKSAYEASEEIIKIYQKHSK